MKKSTIIYSAIIIAVVLVIGGYFGVKNYLSTQAGPEYFFVHPTIAKIFGLAPVGIFYRNSGYGFKMIFPETWKGFTVQEKTWQGWKIDGSGTGKIGDYSGTLVVIRNPQTTTSQQYQDIPIMVFTHQVWAMVSGDNPIVAISAAPIGPDEVGENSKYVFATPPRWYGFTDAIGFEEAVKIVKTFKGF